MKIRFNIAKHPTNSFTTSVFITLPESQAHAQISKLPHMPAADSCSLCW